MSLPSNSERRRGHFGRPILDELDIEMSHTRAQHDANRETVDTDCTSTGCFQQRYDGTLCKRHADLARYQAVTHGAHGR